MKTSTPVNFQAAGLRDPAETIDSGISELSMKKLRIFKDHLAEMPIVVILVGSTSYELPALEVNDNADFIKLIGGFIDNNVIVCHIDYELLPQLELLTQIIHARIYVLDEVPDLERSPSEMMAVGSYRNRVALTDYLALINGKADQLPPGPATGVDLDEPSLDDEE